MFNLFLAIISSACCCTAHGKFTKLNQILHNIVIPLPIISEKIDILSTSADITLFELTCTNISLSDLEVTTKQDHKHQHVQTLFNVTGVAISCHSKFNLTIPGLAFGSGMVDLRSSKTAFSSTLVVLNKKSKSSFLAPESAQLKECDTHVIISQLFFYGGDVAELLNDAKGLILSTVSKLVNGPNGILCAYLKNLTRTEITPLLANISRALQPYMPVPMPPGDHLPWEVAEQYLLSELEPMQIKSLVDWSQSKVITFLHWFIRLELWLPAPCWLPGTSVGTHGINNLFRSLAHNGASVNISLPTPISLVHADTNSVFDVDINLTSISIRGLDTFTQFNILQPISNYTLRSDVSLESLSVNVAFDIWYHQPFENSNQHVHVVVIDALNLLDLELNISTLIAVDKEYLNRLPLGAAVQHLLECVSHAMFQTNVTDVELRVSDIGVTPTVVGALSTDIDQALSPFLALLMDSYERPLLDALPRLITNLVLPKLNQIIDSAIISKRQHGMCNMTIPSRSEIIPKDVNLYSSTIVSLLNTIIEDIVAPSINAILLNITETCGESPGTIGVHGKLLDTTLKVPQIGNITIGLTDLLFTNVDTFQMIHMFDTSEKTPQRMTSNVQIGETENALGASIGVTWDVTPPLNSEQGGSVNGGDSINLVRDTFRIGFDLSNLTFATDLLFSLNRYNTMAIPIGKVTNLTCLVGLLDRLELVGLQDNSSFGSVLYGNLSRWAVNCGGGAGGGGGEEDDEYTCTSSGLKQWSELSQKKAAVEQLSQFLNAGSSDLIQHLESTVFRTEFSQMLENSSKECGFGDIIDVEALKVRRQQRQRRLNDPVPFNQWHPSDWHAPVCPLDKGLATIYGCVCGILLLTFSTWFFVKCSRLEQSKGRCQCRQCYCCNCPQFCTAFSQSCFCRLCFRSSSRGRKNTAIDPTPLLSSEYSEYAIESHQVDTYTDVSKHHEADENNIPALVFHPAISPWVRNGILLLIAVDIGIFFSSHASMGASVDLLINVFGDQYEYDTIFPFGLGYSLVNLWTACKVFVVAFMHRIFLSIKKIVFNAVSMMSYSFTSLTTPFSFSFFLLLRCRYSSSIFSNIFRWMGIFKIASNVVVVVHTDNDDVFNNKRTLFSLFGYVW
jgi:hypothetical protein